MKKVLITGADGFIGSHLTELLYRDNFKIKALSQYNAFNKWGWLEDINCLDKIEVLTGDVRDAQFCKKITKDVDIIFHLAALISIPYSYIAPDSYVETNIKGTLNICQAALENSCHKLIHTSTSEVYGTAKYVPIDEKHPLQPQSPYSASKIGADMLAMSFFNAFDLPVVIARPFNTYGPRQSTRAVIPTIITQIAVGKNEIKLGSVTPTRDLSYVEDICNGILAISKCDKAIGQIVNIGSNYEVSISEVFKVIKEIMNSDANIIVDDKRIRPKKSEVFRLWCDNKLITTLTDWRPMYDLKRGLKNTVKWFLNRNNINKYKNDIYNV